MPKLFLLILGYFFNAAILWLLLPYTGLPFELTYWQSVALVVALRNAFFD